VTGLAPALAKAFGAILTLAMLPAAAAAAEADAVAAGQKTFQACSICHRVGAGAENVVGPELNGIVGRKAGSIDKFAYSAAMKASGLTFTEETLLAFVKAPRTVVPGTRMTYRGLADEAAAKNLVAYLATFRADGSRTVP
jgi:cytochrome c